MPFWLSVILALAGMMLFPVYVEGVALLFLSDLLFGVEEARYFGIVFISLIVGILALLLAEVLKKRLKFYA